MDRVEAARAALNVSPPHTRSGLRYGLGTQEPIIEPVLYDVPLAEGPAAEVVAELGEFAEFDAFAAVLGPEVEAAIVVAEAAFVAAQLVIGAVTSAPLDFGQGDIPDEDLLVAVQDADQVEDALNYARNNLFEVFGLPSTFRRVVNRRNRRGMGFKPRFRRPRAKVAGRLAHTSHGLFWTTTGMNEATRRALDMFGN